jgi:hypothetical protein
MDKMVNGVLVQMTDAEEEQHTAFLAKMNTEAANERIEALRIRRNFLLEQSDWTQMNDSPLSNEDKTAWATYRQELRDLSDLDAWPNLDDADWPVAP